MRKQVHIQAFRSCADVKLKLTTPLVALIGRNGAGKTNVLKGIEWLARTATSLKPLPGEETFFLHVGQPIEVAVDVALSSQLYHYRLSREINVHPGGPEVASRVAFNFQEELAGGPIVG